MRTTERPSETTARNRYTQGMAAFVSALRYERIPEEVIDRIKLLILNSFGCALYSVDLEWSRILMHTLQQLDILRRLGYVSEALCAARCPGQRHAGARV
jgi:hypothetical protein